MAAPATQGASRRTWQALTPRCVTSARENSLANMGSYPYHAGGGDTPWPRHSPSTRRNADRRSAPKDVKLSKCSTPHTSPGTWCETLAAPATSHNERWRAVPVSTRPTSAASNEASRHRHSTPCSGSSMRSGQASLSHWQTETPSVPVDGGASRRARQPRSEQPLRGTLSCAVQSAAPASLRKNGAATPRRHVKKQFGPADNTGFVPTQVSGATSQAALSSTRGSLLEGEPDTSSREVELTRSDGHGDVPPVRANSNPLLPPLRVRPTTLQPLA
jgi:hypothetical protein